MASAHLAVDVHESSQVGQARRAAVQLAEGLAFDEVATGRVALVATELGTNLVRHASNGRLLIAAVSSDSGAPMVEMLSLDRGPGMSHVDTCLEDGYSTTGTPGTGLGAVKRLSSEFDLFSVQSRGTVVMARVAAQAATGGRTAQGRDRVFSYAGVALAAPGETACGDTWSVVLQGGQAAVMVADGLGHGPLAAEASQAAIRLFDSMPFDPPSQVIEHTHTALRTTRGAAVAMAALDVQALRITFSGAGNIAGRVISGVSDRSLVSQHGTAGVQIRRQQDSLHDWPEHALLIMHSDGLTGRWTLSDVPTLIQHHPSVVAGWLLHEHCRGRDDATVVVIKRQGLS